MFAKRLGENNRQQCQNGLNCPQILEMTDGAFAVVGVDITNEAGKALPPGLGIGPKEVVVKIPRDVLIAARSEIPTSI